jgi:hypothetical protein
MPKKTKPKREIRDVIPHTRNRLHSLLQRIALWLHVRVFSLTRLDEVYLAPIIKPFIALRQTLGETLFWTVIGAGLGLFTTTVGFVGNIQSVMKWFSAPVPRYDGTVALGLAGGTAQQPLGYQFRVGLDNTGEILGGAGGIVVLRPNSKGGAAVIVAVQPQALVDRLRLSRNIDAGSGLGLQKMPERLLICVWRDKGRPSTFPIYVYRSD